MATIAALGNPVYDFITTPHISTGGRVLSGCSTNGSLALARLGHASTLVGRVGVDYLEQLQEDARRYNVALSVEPCAQTGGFRLIYDARGDRTLDILGVADPIPAVPKEVIGAADAIIVGPIMQETSPELIQEVNQWTAAPIFLDPQGLMRRIKDNGRIEHYRDAALDVVFPLCTVVKANEMETRIITGVDPREDGREAARRLKALGCAIAIVTLAEAGSLIDDGEHFYRIPAYATIARDPTGAGDTYLAGFIDAYLHQPDDLFAAGCAGAATASIWIEYTGPGAPISREEVTRRAETLRAQGERGR